MRVNNRLVETPYEEFYEKHLELLDGGTWPNRTALCPFHDDKKTSLSVNLETGLWICFAGCGQGNADQFAKQLEADLPNVARVTVEALAEDKGIPEEFLLGLGVKNTGRDVQITYYLEDGQEAPRHRMRSALSAKDGSYWTKGPGRSLPYGLWKLGDARTAETLILVEGESDCWTLWLYGYPALGIPGAASGGVIESGHLTGIRRIYVSHEPDNGGDAFISGIAKRLNEVGWTGEAFRFRLPDGLKDPNALHKKDPTRFKATFDNVLASAGKLVEAKTPNDDQHFTDLGNSQRLVKRHGQDLRYCHVWNTWLVWNGQRWVIDQTDEVERRAKETVRAMYQEAAPIVQEGDRKALVDHARRSEAVGKIQAMVELAKSEPGVPITPDELDSDPWLLNCKNGTIDLKTGKLQPHRREDFITKLAPVDFSSDTAAPTWDKFLLRVLDKKQGLIDYLRRVTGYGITGSTRDHALFFLFGSGRNGKSTYINGIRDTLGPDYSMQAAPTLLLTKKHEAHPTEVADLFRQRFVATTEVENGRSLAEAFVKQLTGGDRLRARRMGQDFWEFGPTHKILLAANHKPVIRGTDEGIWSRIKLIPFTVTIPAEEQDKELPEKLKAEAAGILAWAVRGCLEWQAGGLQDPPEVRDATKEYREEMDTLSDFIEDRCLLGTDKKVRFADLYREYSEWFRSTFGGDPLSSQALGRRMAEKGFSKDRGRGDGARWLVGIGLKASPAPSEGTPERSERHSSSSLENPEYAGDTEHRSVSFGNARKPQKNADPLD